MSGARLEIQWSPVHDDTFITWGTEIFLYNVLQKDEAKTQSCLRISETTIANVLAKNSNHHYVKCVDIYPKKEPDILMAVGQASGKISLSTFGATQYDTSGLAGSELVPKHSRQCNVVAWNPLDCNLIAAGLDRYRSDHCVLAWDVQAGRQHATVAELGLSDTAHSLAWLHNQPRSLVIGMNNKHLKMVDLRDPSKAANSSQTKAVYGLTVSPHHSHLIASYVDNVIAIWDTRSFEKAVSTLMQSKVVAKTFWCPTRVNLLGSLHRDSKSIHLHDVQQMDEMEPYILERCIKPDTSSPLTSFSWHPSHDNRLLAITLSGDIMDYQVFERMTLNWSQTPNLVWTQGQKLLRLVRESEELFDMIGDVSFSMKKRALDGYGLKSQLMENGDLVTDLSMKHLWRWLDKSKSLVEEGTLESKPDMMHPGVKSVLGMDTSVPPNTIPSKSELSNIPWTGMPSSLTAKVYRSEARDKALALCEWQFIHDPALLQKTIRDLQAQGKITKAAAFAVFGLHLNNGIKILAENNLNTVAMALSGYNHERSSIWRESCVASCKKLSDPYLRGIFAFLTDTSDDYDLLLTENEMAVADRIGFALTFLPDHKLADFLVSLSEKLIAEGQLAAILLTGMCLEVIPLLQNYLDITSDIQSVSLICMRTFPPDLMCHERTNYWINSYRELLDSWRMWTQRAHFDIWLNSRTAIKPDHQVYIACNFCGKSNSLHTQVLARQRGSFPRMPSSNQHKTSSCPNCRKPQPRCAICLIHMGTPSCYQPDSSAPLPNTPINPFDLWYSWCQTCRHGGHSAHMQQWFKEHIECPVTGCSCRCLTLDAASNISSITKVS